MHTHTLTHVCILHFNFTRKLKVNDFPKITQLLVVKVGTNKFFIFTFVFCPICHSTTLPSLIHYHSLEFHNKKNEKCSQFPPNPPHCLSHDLALFSTRPPHSQLLISVGFSALYTQSRNCNVVKRTLRIKLVCSSEYHLEKLIHKLQIC